MKVVEFLSCVDETRCTGDKLCQEICPSGAIRVSGKTAAVDDRLCVACGKCVDICRKDAVQLAARDKPLVLSVDVAAFDQDRIAGICLMAQCFPAMMVCACTGTEAQEVAAAILAGAKSPEDLVRMTGIGSGCGIYCMSLVFRLFEAAGVEIPADPRWNPLYLSLWTIPDEVARSYQQYFLEQDLKALSGGGEV